MCFLECTLRCTYGGLVISVKLPAHATLPLFPILVPVMSSFCASRNARLLMVCPWLSQILELTTPSDPLWADNSSAAQEIPHILWKLNGHYRAHKSRHFSPWARWIQSTFTRSVFFKIQFDIKFPSTVRSSKWLFPSDFPTNFLHIFASP